uniref:Chaperone DnaJ C-terminal domain-containing protein n=1 Tax=Anopheles christyi TaxID=43041 RepID=A0A182KC32_9DIPT
MCQVLMQTVLINITPSMRNGDKIVMHRYGHEVGGVTGDLVVFLNQSKNPVFSVVGDDLLCVRNVPLTMAVYGGRVDVKGIDNKNIRIVLAEPFPLYPPLVKRIEGEGMKTLNGRGSLMVKFYVYFPSVPSHLMTESLKVLRKVEQDPKNAEEE